MQSHQNAGLKTKYKKIKMHTHTHTHSVNQSISLMGLGSSLLNFWAGTVNHTSLSVAALLTSDYR